MLDVDLGLEYEKVGKINKGEYIDVFAKVDGWYIIRTKDNLVGTVSEKYVVPSNSEEILVNLEDSNLNDTTLETSTTEFANSNELTEDEKEFLNLINSNRENNGLPKLEIDSEVQNIARLKAQDLVENNYFSHISEKYGDVSAMMTDNNVSFKTIGENIAGNNTLAGAVEAWMNSENHKRNILSTEYNYTGVAVVESERYGKIFVQVFVGK